MSLFSILDGVADGAYYYHVGYRTESTAIFTETELIKTANDKLNNCEQLEINLTTNPITIQDVPVIYGPTPVFETPFEPFNIVINFTEDSCDSNLSIGENNIDNNIIYPNPVGDILYFSKDNLIAFSIYNSLGITVMKGSLIDKSSIQIASLKKGIYFIQIIKDNELQVFKFIKK